jgi:hypothetical protein
MTKNSKMTGLTDLRSGNPGETTMAILDHPIYGEGHAITKVSMSFRYLAGFTPDKGKTKIGSTLSLLLIDAANHTVIKTLYTSPALDKYSFDTSDPYSPPIPVVADGLNVANGDPLMLAIQFTNNQRNLQIPLLDKTGLNVSVEWSATKAPGPAPMPPPGKIQPGTAAVAVLRGPLLYTLLLKQTESLIKRWAPFNNTDVNIESPSPWNYALVLDAAHPLEYVKSELGPNRILPFNTSNYFATIQATARALPGWLEKTNAADEPPASPLDCSKLDGGCGSPVKVTLVPYGSTNLRMSGLPWIGESGSE